MIKYAFLLIVFLLGCGASTLPPTPSFPKHPSIESEVIAHLATTDIEVCKIRCENSACLLLATGKGVLAMVALAIKTPLKDSDSVVQPIMPGTCDQLPSEFME